MRGNSSTSGAKGGFEGVPQPRHQPGLSGYAGSSVKPDMTGSMCGPISFGRIPQPLETLSMFLERVSPTESGKSAKIRVIRWWLIPAKESN